MRRRVKRALGALVLAGVSVAACDATDRQASGDAAARPGESGVVAPRVVLLVSIDTLRPDHLGLYGYSRFTSPVLDDVARQGIVFEDASSTSPWTLPAHASMLTGLHPVGHGVVSMKTKLGEEVPTLARTLGDAGFRSAAVVNSTWLKRESYGLTRDFERYLFVADVPDRRSPNTWVTDQALEWLDEAEASPEERHFIFVHYYDVHSDYASEPAYEELFTRPYDGAVDGTGWQLTRANLDDAYLALCHDDFDPRKCTFGSADSPWVVDESVSRLELGERDVQHLIDLYDAGIRQLDTELGRLFRGLRALGLEDETLLVITSDHGEEFMEHGRVDHFLPTWQEVLRVPLLLRGPGLPVGLRVESPVSLVDLAPTILGQVGVPAPAPLDGLDLAPLWEAEEDTARAVQSVFEERFLYGEAAGGLTYDLVVRGYFPVYRSVRRGRHKLVYESGGGTWKLYDLTVDPGETQDRSAELPEVAAALREEMQGRYERFTPDELDAPELTPEDRARLRELGYVQ